MTATPNQDQGRRASRTLRLPVITGPARPRRSTIGWWRAGTLILVQAAMIAHVLHWWITGRSVGRFVMSDSMRTLELGELNPGFMLFAVSLLLTAVFGRLMCGWVCHMGALQDACAWLLRRTGLRPRLFRSRLLGYVPLAIACYMFLWPTFSRVALQPLLARVWPAAGAALRVRPFPGFSTDVMTGNLWEGLPPWGVAVPFLLLCGFGTVYFLGARGLCRYGCPYGGFILPAEKLAAWSVVVDPAKCDQCGLCTAACTAGVRVHEQVARYGSVTDHNCVRSFDCVGACPQRALSFSLSRPALLRRGAGPAPGPSTPAYDLTLGEELLCAGVFAGTFFTTRGLYNLVPMLMAATLGVIAAFLTWKTWRLLRTPHVRLGQFQLRTHGHLRPAGRRFAASIACLSTLLAHSVLVRAVLHRATAQDDRVTADYADAMQGAILPDQRAAAAAGTRLYTLARPWWRGGLALATTPEAEYRLAWLQLVSGDRPAAENTLRSLMQDGHNTEQAGVELARLQLAAGKRGDAKATLMSALTRRPGSPTVLDLYADLLTREGQSADAERAYRDAVTNRPTSGALRAGLGRLLVRQGRADEGLTELRHAAADWPGDSDIRRDLALTLHAVGNVDEAVAELRAAADARPARREELLALADRMAQR